MLSSRLDEVFASLHVVRLAQNDEFVVSLWRRVQPQLQVRSSTLGGGTNEPTRQCCSQSVSSLHYCTQVALRTFGVHSLPKARSSDLADLDDVLHTTVPSLRNAATKIGVLKFDNKFAERQVPFGGDD